MISADEVRDQVALLVEEHGHLQVASACMRQLAGYGRRGAQADALEGNELLRDEPLPAESEMRVPAPLRSALGKLYRASGHQTFYTVVTIVVLHYAMRGARAAEVDDLSDSPGSQTCAPPPCPGCRERIAALRRLASFRERSRNNRPLGGAQPYGAADE